MLKLIRYHGLCRQFHTAILRTDHKPINPYSEFPPLNTRQVLDQGRVPGPFSFHSHNDRHSDDQGFASKHNTSNAAQVIAYLHKDQVLAKLDAIRKSNPRKHRLIKHHSHHIINSTDPAEGCRNVPNDIKRQVAAQVVFSMFHQPLQLCRLVPILYHNCNLGARGLKNTILFLYYHLTYLNLKESQGKLKGLTDGLTMSQPNALRLPDQLYDLILDPSLERVNSCYLRYIPRYTFLQNCPSNWQGSSQLGKLVDLNRWESSLVNIQLLAKQGQWWQALDQLIQSHSSYIRRASLEYLSTFNVVLVAAEKSQSLNAAVVHEIVSLILERDDPPSFAQHYQHPYVWEFLIHLSTKYASVKALELISQKLMDQGWRSFQTRPLIQLLQARDHLGIAPLEPYQSQLLETEASRNPVVACILIQTWRNYFRSQRNDIIHEESPSITASNSIYSKLTPLYRSYFKTTLLTSMSLPCHPDLDPEREKLAENGVALCLMLHSYMQDNSWSLDITLTLYRRFRDILATRPDIIEHLDQKDIAEIFVVFLTSIARGRQGSVDMCMGIVTDIVNIINHPNAPARTGWKTNVISTLTTTRTWLLLLNTFAHHGHYEAAEKVLLEIRRYTPSAYANACKILHQTYTTAGKLFQADDIANRREASGQEDLHVNLGAKFKPFVTKKSLQLTAASTYPCHWLPEHLEQEAIRHFL